MKKIVLLVLVISFFSCKEEVQKQTLPVRLSNVFKKHGGLIHWKKMQTLSFNKGKEIHTIDLHSRKTVIHTSAYALGFDGNQVWLDEEVEESFQKNPNFYYNLYFYFYAMPFVLADDGIIYEKVDDLMYKNKSYPGYKISYKKDKGTSPDDNYIMYYNSETYQMEWLAYTVTFKTKTSNNNYKLIKYDTWENVDGLLLPKKIIWYKKNSNGMPTEPAKPALEFTLPLVSDSALDGAFFEKSQK